MKPKRVIVLTGAGISAESGIQTFRAADGLWENHRVEDVATPEGFERNPALVHRFYNERRRKLLSDSVKPNLAHFALAEYEARAGAQILIITQNIDDLHERAGTKNLIHMHGELLKIRCEKCGEIFSCTEDIEQSTVCRHCAQRHCLRPHIVWFGESPMGMDDIFKAIGRCDLFLSIGTSGNVYPAADFAEIAANFGAHTVELNLEPSKLSTQFAERHFGFATKTVPDFFANL